MFKPWLQITITFHFGVWRFSSVPFVFTIKSLHNFFCIQDIQGYHSIWAFSVLGIRYHTNKETEHAEQKGTGVDIMNKNADTKDENCVTIISTRPNYNAKQNLPLLEHKGQLSEASELKTLSPFNNGDYKVATGPGGELNE